MAQAIHYTNGPGLPVYPNDLEVKPVDLYVHDSGMIATHDYSCPVCRERHAVIDFRSGLMQPCWECQKTFTRITTRKWWHKFLGI